MKEPPTLTSEACWAPHIEALIDHERGLQRSFTLRATIMALVATSIALGGPLLMAGTRWWGGMGWAPAVLLALAFAAALASAAVAWLALAPMEGRGWRPHTLTCWLHQKASQGLNMDLLGGVLPSRTAAWRENLRQARRMAPDLSAKVRAAVRRADLDPHEAHRCPEARSLVAAWLRDSLGADLSWWLDPGDSEQGDRQAATRLRLVFWLWLHRQVAQALADMIWLAIKLGVLAFFLVLAALVLHWLGWWLLSLLPLAGGLLVLRWVLAQAQV